MPRFESDLDMAGHDIVNRGNDPGGGGGANIKAGTLSFATDTWVSVSFVTDFSTVPKVVVTADANQIARWDFSPIIRNVTVSGFDVRYDDRSQAGTVIISWIATDAGNP